MLLHGLLQLERGRQCTCRRRVPAIDRYLPPVPELISGQHHVESRGEAQHVVTYLFSWSRLCCFYCAAESRLSYHGAACRISAAGDEHMGLRLL